MKSFIAVSVLALSIVNAQTIPSCALQCFASAIGKAGCDLTDYYCQCTQGKEQITTDVTSCILESSCTQNDLTTIQSAVSATCSAAIASHSAGASFGSSSGSTSTSQASATGSSSSSVVVAAVSSATSSAASAASSAAGSATSSGSAAASSSTSGANMVRAGGAALGLSVLALLSL